MNSTKRTKTIAFISFTTFLSVAFLLTLYTTKTTKLYFTNNLIPSTVLLDNSFTPHMPQMIDRSDSVTQETDYLTEDIELSNPFIQNPIVIPEVLELDEDMNS